MGPDDRINTMMDRLEELRKLYQQLKHEVSWIDRKRKKAKKREQEGNPTITIFCFVQSLYSFQQYHEKAMVILGTCSFIYQSTSTRRQRRDFFGLPSKAATCCYQFTTQSWRQFRKVPCPRTQQANLPAC